MKQKITLAIFAVLLSLIISSYSSGYAANGGDGTGATGSAGCSCHNISTSITTTVELDSAGTAVTSYVPGKNYTIKITGTNTSTSTLKYFGFQLATVQSAGAGTGSAVGVGNWGTSLPTSVQLTSAASSGLPMDVIEQSGRISATSGSGGSGTTYVESIPWIAPAQGTGSVKVYGVMNAVNGNGSSSGDKSNAASPVTITEAVSCSPVTVSIAGSGHTLTATAVGATSYQWYLNGTPISGATSSTYTATTSGSYTVQATTSGGCSGTSSAYTFSTVGINDLSLSEAVSVYPSVTESSVNVRINASVGALNYSIYGLDGRKYESGTIATGSTNATIDMSHMSTGIYIISMEDQSRTATYKIVKQ